MKLTGDNLNLVEYYFDVLEDYFEVDLRRIEVNNDHDNS